MCPIYVSPNHPDYERLTRGVATAEAPRPSGDLLAAFARKGPAGLRQELRIVLDEYQDHPYISVRVWQCDRDGAWWPTKKGVSIRLSECDGVAEALRAALDRDDPGGPSR